MSEMSGTCVEKFTEDRLYANHHGCSLQAALALSSCSGARSCHGAIAMLNSKPVGLQSSA